MNFTSTVEINGQVFGCDVEAHYIPEDTETGYAAEWDLFVSVNGHDVTYDITRAERVRLEEESVQHAQALATDSLISNFEYKADYE